MHRDRWKTWRLDRWRAGPQADLHRLPVAVDLRAINLAEGARAALAIAAIFLVDAFLHVPGLPEAALGSLLTCLCDAGGPMRRRVPALLGFALIGAALVAGFGLVRPYGLGVTVPLAAAAIFCCAFARVWSQAALQVGNLLIVVIVLSLDHVVAPAQALDLGALFAGGSLWALLLTMVIWRLHPYRPARRAVADVFRRLGLMVADLVPLLHGEPALTWEDHARAHRRHVRDGIEAARTMVTDTLRIRGGGSARANQTVVQIEAADQLFGVLIAISDVLETADATTRAAAARALPALRLLLAALADATARDHAQDDPAVAAMTARLLDAFVPLDAIPALGGLAQALVDRLRIALLLTTPDGLFPGRDGTFRPDATRIARIARPVLANLHWHSAILRHATRSATVAAPALLFTLSMGDVYAHWLTITLLLTLQPFFAATWQRALERSAGTMTGGVVAALIATVVHGPLPTVLAMAPLAITAFAVRSVSYAVFIGCLTPMVVLLSELGAPGSSEIAIAALRAGYTVAGGLLAVAAGMLLWPSWERARVHDAMTAAIRAHAAYAELELATLLRPDGTATEPLAEAATLETVRRTAGLASNNLETALNRALQEPRRSVRSVAHATLVVDAALRRLAGRLLALQHDPAQAGSDPALLAAWRSWLGAALTALANGDRLPAAAPPDRSPVALSRMGRQVELMASALRPAQLGSGNSSRNV